MLDGGEEKMCLMYFKCLQLLYVSTLHYSHIPAGAITKIYSFRHFSSGHRQQDGSSAVLTRLNRGEEHQPSRNMKFNCNTRVKDGRL